MRNTAANTWTYYIEPENIGEVLPPFPGDALSQPSVDDLLPSGLSLWPRGAAWGTPDGMAADQGSVLAQFTRALLGPFTELYARLYAITNESRALTLIDSLDDWERDFGLPNECSVSSQSTASRRQALISKVRSTATITPQDYIQLAFDEGFEIAIEEPVVFECGFSECGGDHTTGSVLQEVYWIVHVEGLAIDYFVVGESELGFDQLFSVTGAERLQCLFSELYPGWTQPVYVVSS